MAVLYQPVEDGVVHNSYRLVLKGESMRKRRGGVTSVGPSSTKKR
jgi:hypothetical protein